VNKADVNEVKVREFLQTPRSKIQAKRTSVFCQYLISKNGDRRLCPYNPYSTLANRVRESNQTETEEQKQIQTPAASISDQNWHQFGFLVQFMPKNDSCKYE